MEIILMLASILLFLSFIMIWSKKQKRDESKLEYKEWMCGKGFVKIEIELFDQNEFDYETTGIVTTTHLVGYVQSGVFNFILGKNNFCDFELFPELPKYNDIKKTAPILLNTGAVKSFKQIDN